MRTEQDIINDLAKLGWKYKQQKLSYEYEFHKGYNVIEIRGGDRVRTYEENYSEYDEENHTPIFIEYEVYCLIYELLNVGNE